jgi:hypothetical protein
MKYYAERIDELISDYGGKGQLADKGNGIYEFIFDRSGADTTSYSGADFIGVSQGSKSINIPLERLIVIEKFD